MPPRSGTASALVRAVASDRRQLSFEFVGLPERAEPPPIPPSEGPQLGLFDHEQSLVQRVCELLAVAHWSDAEKALQPGLARYPFRFAPLVRRFELIQQSLSTLPTAVGPRAEALYQLASSQDAPDAFGRAMHQGLLRTAVAVAWELGPSACLGGLPVGAHLLGIDVSAARGMLHGAVLGPRSMQQIAALALLGDLDLRDGEMALGGRRVLRALATNPFAVPFGMLSDPGLAGLTTLAADWLSDEVAAEDLARTAVAWTAPVGVLAGVLPLPRLALDQLVAEYDVGVPPTDARDGEELVRVRAFLRALATASGSSTTPEGMAARRTMRTHCRPLFERWLGRRN